MLQHFDFLLIYLKTNIVNYDCDLENELTITLKLNNTIYCNLYLEYLITNNRFDICIKHKSLMYKIDYNLIPEIYRTYAFTIVWSKNTKNHLNKKYIIKNNEFVEKNIFNAKNITEIIYYEKKLNQ